MRHSDKERLDELSAALDAVNRGERPGSQDEEIKELAAVAELLKRSGPPPEIVAGLADTLSAELATRNRRRRLWLTSGAAGTAAAALLVFVLNTGPAAPPQAPMTVPPAGSVVIQTVPQPAPETARAGDVAPPAKQPVPAAKEPAPAAKEAAPAPVPEKPAAVAAENFQAKQRTILAQAPEKTAERAANKAAAKAFLVWPGHEPDTVTEDKGTGAVRQVYGGGDGAVVITQRPAGDKTAAADGAAKAGGESGTNRVTLTVRDMAVTVEGNLPVEELQKIARSLR